MGEADVPFLEPSMELGQNISYSTEIWYSICFYREQYGTVEKLQRNCHHRRKPLFTAKFLFFLAKLDIF